MLVCLRQVQGCQHPTHRSDVVRWGFERASEPLLKMYRFPRDPAAAALLHRGVRKTGKSGSSISSGQSTPPSTPSPPGSEDGQGGERAAHAWEAEGQNTLADALAVIGSHAYAFSPEFRCRVLPQISPPQACLTASFDTNACKPSDRHIVWNWAWECWSPSMATCAHHVFCVR